MTRAHVERGGEVKKRHEVTIRVSKSFQVNNGEQMMLEITTNALDGPGGTQPPVRLFAEAGDVFTVVIED